MPYFSMVLSTLNLIFLRKLQKKFEEGIDPYKCEGFDGHSHVNPIGRDDLFSSGIQMKSYQVRYDFA